MNKKYPKTAAVIDIGSSDLLLYIAQLQKGRIHKLDRITYPLSLGHEVFTEKKVSYECFREMSKALKGFSALMKEYEVTKYYAVATTALREAENRAFVLDQLKVQNKLNVEVLEADQEKTYVNFEILSSLKDAGALEPGCSLFAFIGTGTIGAAVYDGSTMIYSQNVPIGALKLHDMLYTIQNQTEDFGSVVEEYLGTILGYQNLTQFDIHNIILIGNDMKLITRLCGAEQDNGFCRISVKEVTKLFQSIRSLRPDKISQRYNLSEDVAEILYSALAIHMQIVGKTAAQQILSPQINLWDALMHQILVPKRRREYEDYVHANAISCARHIAENYHCDRAHTDAVREIACTIFDRIKHLHGMGNSQRLVLELAAILHESGHYVAVKEHLGASFDIIRHTDIYGITKQDTLLAAYVARYNEYSVPDFRSVEYIAMPEADRTIIAKLVAIFRLANSLDKSRRQKIKDVTVKLKDDQMLVSAKSNENIFLEKWAFEQSSTYFKEVFGLYPVLKIRQDLI